MDGETAGVLLLHWATLCRCDVARYTADWLDDDHAPTSSARAMKDWRDAAAHYAAARRRMPWYGPYSNAY